MIIWNNVYNFEWFCEVEKISQNWGILSIQSCFQDIGITRKVCLAYGTGDMADPNDIDDWKSIALEYIGRKRKSHGKAK